MTKFILPLLFPAISDNNNAQISYNKTLTFTREFTLAPRCLLPLIVLFGSIAVKD